MAVVWLRCGAAGGQGPLPQRMPVSFFSILAATGRLYMHIQQQLSLAGTGSMRGQGVFLTGDCAPSAFHTLLKTLISSPPVCIARESTKGSHVTRSQYICTPNQPTAPKPPDVPISPYDLRLCIASCRLISKFKIGSISSRGGLAGYKEQHVLRGFVADHELFGSRTTSLHRNLIGQYTGEGLCHK